MTVLAFWNDYQNLVGCRGIELRTNTQICKINPISESSLFPRKIRFRVAQHAFRTQPSEFYSRTREKNDLVEIVPVKYWQIPWSYSATAT